MGLKTFWAQISGQRIQEIPLKSHSDSTSSFGKRTTIIYEKELEDLSPKIKSPAITASRSRTGSLSRKRKSWFGTQPIHESTIPAVPVLDRQYIRQPGAAFTKDSFSGLGVLPEPFTDEGRRKNRRLSLTRKASLRSVRNNYERIDALPPMPALPTNMIQAVTAPTSQPEQRKSRTMSFGRKSIDEAAKSKQRRRRSLWTSSNPDDSEDESIPPVPALMRDGSQSPQFRRSREHRRKDSKSDDMAPAPGANGHRRTYTPRNAAAGFLMSTSGASEATRKSFRKSFHIADNDDLVCLTDEQRREWEKLKSLTSNFTQDIERHDNPDSATGPKYSNKQALAALEFGLR